MIEITSQPHPQQQLTANPKLLALFHASWCPFCRAFLTTFNKYAAQPNALLTLKVRIDEDENPLWEIYGFEAVPSLILFENGQVKQRLDCNLGQGLTERQFLNWLNHV
jgi:thiol-disulfide isomerase/thioredoxin